VNDLHLVCEADCLQGFGPRKHQGQRPNARLVTPTIGAKAPIEYLDTCNNRGRCSIGLQPSFRNFGAVLLEPIDPLEQDMQASSSHLSLISGRSDSDPLLSERLDAMAPATYLYTAAGKPAVVLL
jgi:hypothetical protein